MEYLDEALMSDSVATKNSALIQAKTDLEAHANQTALAKQALEHMTRDYNAVNGRINLVEATISRIRAVLIEDRERLIVERDAINRAENPDKLHAWTILQGRIEQTGLDLEQLRT